MGDRIILTPEQKPHNKDKQSDENKFAHCSAWCALVTVPATTKQGNPAQAQKKTAATNLECPALVSPGSFQN